jgi:hypothetical protein
MGKSTVFLGTALALILVLACPSLRSESASAFELFFWLLAILVVSGVALWPSTARDQRAELRLERPGWADRIEFGGTGKAAQGTTAPPGSPSQSSGAA